MKISSAIFVMLLTAMFLGLSMTAIVASPPHTIYRVIFSGDIETAEEDIQSGATYRPNSIHLRDKSDPTLTLVGTKWGDFAFNKIGPIHGNDFDLYVNCKSGTVSIYFVFEYGGDTYRLYVSGEYTGEIPSFGVCNAEASIHQVVNSKKNKPTDPVNGFPIAVQFSLDVDYIPS